MASRVHATRRQVLLVEDESPIRVAVTDLLEDEGYVVLQATDGREAQRKLDEQRPDLIVLDLMLPEMSGWKFLEGARSALERYHIPVMILSAIKGESDYPSTLGVAAWVTKPIDVEQFLDAVRELTNLDVPSGTGDAPILVVEDDKHIRSLIVEALGERGFEARAAATLDEARTTLSERPPALILLDLMLPGESGSDFLRERATDPRLASIPVLVLSAAPRSRLVEAKQLGADAFMSKPFDFDALGAVVQSFVK